MFAGTLDGGDGVSFGDSPILCGDSPRIKFRATKSQKRKAEKKVKMEKNAAQWKYVSMKNSPLFGVTENEFVGAAIVGLTGVTLLPITDVNGE